MNTKLAGTETELVAYFNFDEGSGQVSINHAGTQHGQLDSTNFTDSHDPRWIETAFPTTNNERYDINATTIFTNHACF